MTNVVILGGQVILPAGVGVWGCVVPGGSGWGIPRGGLGHPLGTCLPGGLCPPGVRYHPVCSGAAASIIGGHDLGTCPAPVLDRGNRKLPATQARCPASRSAAKPLPCITPHFPELLPSQCCSKRGLWSPTFQQTWQTNIRQHSCRMLLCPWCSLPLSSLTHAAQEGNPDKQQEATLKPSRSSAWQHRCWT